MFGVHDVPVLAENALVAERRRRTCHPVKVCPELVATAPRQVCSWDITKLAGPVKGTYFDAYVMVGIYSRYLVGVHVHAHEPGVLAKELMEQIFTMHGVPQVVYADRGSRCPPRPSPRCSQILRSPGRIRGFGMLSELSPVPSNGC